MIRRCRSRSGNARPRARTCTAAGPRSSAAPLRPAPWPGAQGRPGGGLGGLVLRLRVLVRRQFALRRRRQIVRRGRALRLLLLGRRGRGRLRFTLRRRARGRRRGGLGGRRLGRLVRQLAVDLLLGLRSRRVVRRLLLERLRRRLGLVFSLFRLGRRRWRRLLDDHFDRDFLHRGRSSRAAKARNRRITPAE